MYREQKVSKLKTSFLIPRSHFPIPIIQCILSSLHGSNVAQITDSTPPLSLFIRKPSLFISIRRKLNCITALTPTARWLCGLKVINNEFIGHYVIRNYYRAVCVGRWSVVFVRLPVQSLAVGFSTSDGQPANQTDKRYRSARNGTSVTSPLHSCRARSIHGRSHSARLMV